LLDSI